MPDTLLSAADALVAALAAAFPTWEICGNRYAVTCQWSADVNIELTSAQLAAPLVWVLDAADDCQSDRGECHEDFDLLVIVQMGKPANIDEEQMARDLSGLSAAVRDFLKSRDAALELDVGDGDAMTCIKARRPVARNHDEWHHDSRFFSEILGTFRRY
jgi:hypothetical protein